MKQANKKKQLEDPIYKYFMAAFRDKLPTTERKIISSETGITVGYISDVLNDKAKATYDKRDLFAGVFGYEYEEFIEYGKRLKTGQVETCKKQPTVSLPEKPETETQFQGDDEVLSVINRILDEKAEMKADFEKEKEEIKAGLKSKIAELESEISELKEKLAEKHRKLQEQSDQFPGERGTASNDR